MYDTIFNKFVCFVSKNVHLSTRVSAGMICYIKSVFFNGRAVWRKERGEDAIGE